MHYSRVLLPLVVLSAACAQTDAQGDDPLGRDLLLATQVHTDAVERELSALGGAGVCPSEPGQTPPSAAQQAQAGQLLRKAQETALMGDARRAHQLLREAAQFDGSNPELAYQLARSSDALDDRSAAVDAYCRFLTLAPGTQQAAEVRGRLTALTRVESAAQDTRQAAEPKPATRAAARPVARPVRRAAPTRTASRPRAGRTTAARHESRATGSTRTESSAGTLATETPVVHEPVVREPTAQPTAPVARAERDNTARGALIGAAAGAIVGAAVGRDVKSGVVGAAAGGLIGAVVGRTVGGSTRGQAFKGGTLRTPTWSPR
jgi:hypothetical protein